MYPRQVYAPMPSTAALVAIGIVVLLVVLLILLVIWVLTPSAPSGTDNSGNAVQNAVNTALTTAAAQAAANATHAAYTPPPGTPTASSTTPPIPLAQVQAGVTPIAGTNGTPVVAPTGTVIPGSVQPMTAQSQPPPPPPASQAAPTNPNDITHPGQTFGYVPGYDSPGNTIMTGVYMPDQVCNTVAGCIGYNSNGDLKSAILPEAQWVPLAGSSSTQGAGNMAWNGKCGTLSNAGLYIGTDSNFPYSSYQYANLPAIPNCINGKLERFEDVPYQTMELNEYGTPRTAISW
jgi:hypothetical protein